jgi:Rps23 Pro-64 3,4-dihydroxylase Tpa1-like proline 4-hydroxylase
MKKVELVPGLCVYSNVLEDPGSVVSVLKTLNLPWTEALVAESRYRDHKDKSLKDIRDAEVVPVYKNHELVDDPSLKKLGVLFNSIFSAPESDFISSYDVEVSEKEDPYQLLRYSAGQFIIPHVDSTEEFPRKVTMIYYPNDDYVGGELHFPQINVTLKPEANSVVVFLADSVLFSHSSEKIKTGTKYAVVGLWK